MSNNIKFAVVSDNSSQPSYYCEGGRYINYSDDEDITHTDLPYTSFWTFPELFDGHYIDLNSPWGLYPKEDFDLIFAAIECDKKHLYRLRKLYPNAVIIGMYKEYWNNDPRVRNYIIENTDAYTHPYWNTPEDIFKSLGCIVPKKYCVISQPVNHKTLQKKYKREKKSTIFDYNKKIDRRMGRNNNFVIKKILESGVKLKPVYYDGPRGLQNFIDAWSDSKYMLSTDGFKMGGVQSVQCTVLKTIMVGGSNDSHRVLFPELVGTDVDFLVSKIIQLESDSEYRKKVRDYSYKMYKKCFSHESVRGGILKIYGEIKNGK